MWNIVVEGYKPQDFSFFHRSEKLVQRMVSKNDENFIALCEEYIHKTI